MHRATHVVFSKPTRINGIVHRGLVATDHPSTVSEQLDRRLWAVALFFHAPIQPRASSQIDLYFCSLTHDACPSPKIAITDRDLTDETKFFPMPDIDPEYDVIFNMNWMPFKRHELFIETLRYSQSVGRTLRCLWFGYHYNCETQQRETMLKAKVADLSLDVEFADTDFNTVEVNQRYNRSRVSVICSTGEGGPRVFAESLLADVPLVVTQDTAGGVPETLATSCGVISEPNPQAMAESIWYALDHRPNFSPRHWALENICLSRTLPRLIQAVQELSISSSFPINADIRFDGYDWEAKAGLVKQIEKEYWNSTKHRDA